MRQDVRVKFLEFLPEIYGAEKVNGKENLAKDFLEGYEAVFEELEAELEGNKTIGGTDPGNNIKLFGGIPELFSISSAPPPEFKYCGEKEEFTSSYLDYLSEWIGLPLRDEKNSQWKRGFIMAAIPLYEKRGTLEGIESLLKLWLRDELEVDLDRLIYFGDEDKKNIEKYRDWFTVFENDKYPYLDNEELNKFFYVIIELKSQYADEVESIAYSARMLLNHEKPAYTSYEIKIRAKKNDGNDKPFISLEK